MNELQTKQENAVALNGTTGPMLGATDNMTSEDILTPVIWLLQDMSKLVQDDVMEKGTVINSITNEVLLDAKSKDWLKFIVVDFFKTRQIFETANTPGAKAKWVKTEPYRSGMEQEPWSEMIDGILIDRKLVQNYLVFLPKDINSVDLGGDQVNHFADPYILKFKGASYTKGKNLNSQLTRFSKFQKPSWFPIFELNRTREENEKGKFFVWDFRQAGNTEADHKEAALIAPDMLASFRANKDQYKIIDIEESAPPSDDLKDVSASPAVDEEIPY